MILSSNSVPISLVSTGGLTYAQYTVALGGCTDLVRIGPALQQGSAFSCDFDLQVETGVPCPEYILLKHGAVALGALPPGRYSFSVTDWGHVATTIPFQVPSDTGRTLEAVGITANGAFQMRINGVADVEYIVQASTNLVTWTTLSTNAVGQAVIDGAANSLRQRYYRIVINQ